MAVSYINLGLIYRDKKPDKVKAKSYFQAAEQHWVELVAIAPQYVAFRNNLEWVQEALERLGNG